MPEKYCTDNFIQNLIPSFSPDHHYLTVDLRDLTIETIEVFLCFIILLNKK
jgi:hypothetical protein